MNIYPPVAGLLRPITTNDKRLLGYVEELELAKHRRFALVFDVFENGGNKIMERMPVRCSA